MLVMRARSAGGDELVAFGRESSGPDERSARDHQGLAGAARLVANVSMALASVCVAASLTLGTTKARWMTPSLVEGTGAQHVEVVQVATQHLGAMRRRLWRRRPSGLARGRGGRR